PYIKLVTKSENPETSKKMLDDIIENYISYNNAIIDECIGNIDKTYAYRKEIQEIKYNLSIEYALKEHDNFLHYEDIEYNNNKEDLLEKIAEEEKYQVYLQEHINEVKDEIEKNEESNLETPCISNSIFLKVILESYETKYEMQKNQLFTHKKELNMLENRHLQVVNSRENWLKKQLEEERVIYDLELKIIDEEYERNLTMIEDIKIVNAPDVPTTYSEPNIVLNTIIVSLLTLIASSHIIVAIKLIRCI
ncbi:MAG: hypothetical protein KKD39_01200, partial [Candidatus Altiarchaeota archaeon]|nr:hypothetical protein [Candidatus Altiarchaeota archaeon]